MCLDIKEIKSFFEGELVIIRKECSGCREGEICQLKFYPKDNPEFISPGLYAVGENGKCSCPDKWTKEKIKSGSEWYLFNKNHNYMNGCITEDLKTINPIAENLLDDDTKKLIEAGIINRMGLEITGKGSDILWGLLFASNKEALLSQADKIIAARKKQ